MVSNQTLYVGDRIIRASMQGEWLGDTPASVAKVCIERKYGMIYTDGLYYHRGKGVWSMVRCKHPIVARKAHGPPVCRACGKVVDARRGIGGKVASSSLAGKSESELRSEARDLSGRLYYCSDSGEGRRMRRWLEAEIRVRENELRRRGLNA